MKKLLIAISAMLAAVTLQARDIESEIVDEIMRNNPELAAQAAAMRAETAAARADNNLADPEVEFERTWASREGVDNKWSLSVSQSFEWPGAYRARSRANQAQAEALTLLQRARVLDKALEVRQLLLDWDFALRRRDMLETIAANTDSLEAATARAFEHGEATILDVKKLKLQKLKLHDRLAEAQAGIDATRAALIALNGGRSVNGLDPAARLTQLPEAPALADEATYLDAFRNGDPTLAAQKAQKEAARNRIKAANAASFPGLSLGYVHAYEEGAHFNGFSVGLTLPVFSRRNRRAAAEAEAAEISWSGIDYEMRVNADIIATYAKAKKLRRQLDSYNEAFIGSDYVSLLGYALAGGEISLIDYITETNFYLEAYEDYLTTEHAYRSALTRLRRWEL